MLKIFRQPAAIMLIPVTFLLLQGCSASMNTPSPDKGDNSSGYFSGINLDTVKAGPYDMGRMWTFEYPPVDYFQKEYNFRPTREWLDHVRKSALRFADYCSASFVSRDGLVMTNDHCGRESVSDVSNEGEDLLKNGFFAETLKDERPVPGLYVDQLVLIKDVTDEIQQAMSFGETEEEKTAIEDSIMTLIRNREQDSTSLKIQITPLYNGAKYSEYGYKRYTDVRLVFAPETELGFFGGDPDNFTYPRYDLDCTFFRVYGDDGKPLKTDDYFKWSDSGAVAGEPVFVVGNPGSTDRLNTLAQLEYLRDVSYPHNLELLNNMIGIYSKMIKENPDRKGELQNRLYRFTNSQKVYNGMLEGLRDPVLMQKKKDFEAKFKAAVMADPGLKDAYGDLWDKISGTRRQMRGYSNELYALSLNPLTTSELFFVARDVADLAYELKLPEDQRDEQYAGGALDTTIADIFPGGLDLNNERDLLKGQIRIFDEYLGKDNSLVQKLTGGRTGDDAVDYMLNNTLLTDSLELMALIDKGADAILNSDDPFIYFAVHTEDRRAELRSKVSEILNNESVYSQELGKALFKVYGTSIPPDATFTLRIADGVVKGFPYNGTVAPAYTTFYGLYDRYYSFDRKEPWSLPDRWVHPPADFRLETPFNFVATNDIVGGNSGSPVINEKGEIVGLAFDGNIQSLPGSFIYTPEENRMVAVHSAGLLEAVKDLYKAARLSDELKNGKLTDEKVVSDSTK
jgi:hypothetical protein